MTTTDATGQNIEPGSHVTKGGAVHLVVWINSTGNAVTDCSRYANTMTKTDKAVTCQRCRSSVHS